MARTKDYGEKVASKFQKQIGTVDADKYGGANTVTLGAGDLKFYDTLEISDPKEVVQDQARNGTQSANYQEVFADMPTIEGEGALYNEGMLDDVTSAMGWETLDGPYDSGDATNYVHMILFQNNGKDQREFTTAEQALIPGWASGTIYNPFKTFAKDRGPSTEIAKNTAIQQFEIAGQPRQPVMFKFSGNSETVTRDASHTGVDSWTASGFDSRYKLFQGVFSVGVDQGALTEYGITEFSLKGNFGMATELQPTGTSNGGLSRAEPCSTGLSEVTFDFKIHKHSSDTWKTWEADQTILNAKLELTNGNQKFNIFLPMLQVGNIDIEADDGSSVMVNCRAFLPTNTDPFATERTVNSIERTLPFSTPVYMMVTDTDNTNHLLASS